MPSKEGWTQENSHSKIKLGTKVYRNMEEWTRPCAMCGEKFNIFIRAGDGGNASFGLRTCKAHRGQKYQAGAAPVAPVHDNADVAALRDELETEKNENAALQRAFKQVFDELQECKAKLAKYEPSLTQALVGVHVMPTNGSEQKTETTFPWSPS